MKKKEICWNFLFFTVFLQAVEPDHTVAGIADIILLCPARRACPPAAEDALPQFTVCKRLIAQVAEKTGETPGVLLRGLALFPQARDITLQTGDKVPALFLVTVTSRGFAFPEFQSVPPFVQWWCPSPARRSLTTTCVFRRLRGLPLSHF